MNGFYLANPWGLLALLALPAIVAIHFLQRRTTPVEVSTLFLIQPMLRPTRGGRVFSYLRSSWPLWCQLLAALLLAFILAQPKVLARESTQQIAIVLDSSYSMQAFREEALEATREAVDDLAANAVRTEWRVLSSDPLAPPIYAGTEVESLRTALERWQPEHGTLDPAEVLSNAARSAQGIAVIYVTDHTQPLPASVTPILVGQPLENMGFAGVTTDPIAGTWTVLIQNYSDLPQSRQFWSSNAEGERTASQAVVLEGGTTKQLTGSFREPSLTLHLTSDAFSLDDTLPLTRPRPKPLRVDLKTSSQGFRDLIESLPAIVSGGTTEAPVEVFEWTNPEATLPAVTGIAHLGNGNAQGALLDESAYGTRHALVEGLDWNGLLAPDTPGIAMIETDTVLVWAGERPLIFLREQNGESLLMFNFDPEQSNLDRLPAFVLLTSRFLERLRIEGAGTEQGNFELRESLAEILPPGIEAQVITRDGEPSDILMAPVNPGMFEVKTPGEEALTLLQASSYFAETREADFRRTTRGSELTSLIAELRDRNRNVDFFTPLWILLAIGLMLAAWALSRRSTF